MTPADFSFLQSFLKTRSGLDLAADKQYLIDSRLNPIVRKRQLGDLANLVRALRTGTDKALENVVVEAMTTNESSIDRIIRLVIGIAALVGAFAVGFGSVGGIILAVVGVVMLVTAAVGFCPLYRVFGISTCKVPASR